MFDENNTEKKFIGSQRLGKNKTRTQNAHKVSNRVNHKGKDLKGSYSDTGKTLFSTLKSNLSSGSNSVSVTPTKPFSKEENKKDMSSPIPVVSVQIDDQPKNESKKQPKIKEFVTAVDQGASDQKTQKQ